jgi:hypothetical protein
MKNLRGAHGDDRISDHKDRLIFVKTATVEHGVSD